jgi:Zn ribbon nucleic-acid-binding protein
MLFLKACPHCGGDLAVEQEQSWGYVSCIQCGHTLSTAQERVLGISVTRRGVRHVRQVQYVRRAVKQTACRAPHSGVQAPRKQRTRGGLTPARMPEPLHAGRVTVSLD